MTEHALTVVRQPVAAPKAKKDDEKVTNVRPPIWRYCDSFFHKIHGRPSNTFVNYEPPSARCRLRDAEGKPLRKNAEKSVLINEYLLDLFVPPEGLVYDMFAGTGSMALACIKTQRYYVGSEIDPDVHLAATQRLGKAWFAYDRGELVATEAGCRRSLAEQVKHTHTRHAYK